MSFKKFPTFQEIAPVYAVGVVIFYSDALVKFFYEFSSWSLFMDAADIAGLFAYAIAGAFLESLFLIGALLFLNLIMPEKITSGKFILYGTTITIAFLGALFLRYQIGTQPAMIFFAGISIVLLALGWRFKFIRAIFEGLADRCVIFLYLYLPLSLISVLIIFIRNIG